jgi:hypothetical protein
MRGVKKKEEVVLKREKKIIGVFIDGTGLDRASRRLKRKVNLSALVKGVSSGQEAVFARYYTIVPFEDDSRHRAFLDAVSRAGLDVLAKRLPPKGIDRQVSTDSELSSDLIAFGLGHLNNYDLSNERIEMNNLNSSSKLENGNEASGDKVKRIAVIVCPSRDLSYAISFLKQIKVDTVSADFSNFAGNDVLKSAAKWIDLSDSQTIWQDQ